jgi:oxygen-independent coproporphyrinogen-3 oxidase
LDVGLYIHVPFCSSKCGYCDFYSIVADAECKSSLVDALLKELDNAVSAQELRVETIFVGGGTPSILSIDMLIGLFSSLGRVAGASSLLEFTVECNPATLNEEKAHILYDRGVTRISLGAQSFNADELGILQRSHNPDDISASVEIIQRTGFDHLNLDMVFGIPGQTLASWTDSLRKAVDLGADHLACYGLTYEADTPLYERRAAGLIRPVDEDLEVQMYQSAIDFLSGFGFEHYEISNFARGGGKCLHNLRYWRNEPVIGVGPSAWSYMAGRRWRNVPEVNEYVRRIAAGEDLSVESEVLSGRERAGELAMLRLRLSEGLDCREFQRITGFSPYQLYADIISQHVKKGLLSADGGHIALTRRGKLVADTVIADFLLPING